MHPEILGTKQKKVLPLLKKFKKSFSLAGGTAIAWQLGHRRSIDFDLFSLKPFSNISVHNSFISDFAIDQIIFDDKGEYSFVASGVKFSFIYYPFPVEFKLDFGDFKTAELLTLAALKAYALGRRAKWKDYVDVYFILNSGISLDKIVLEAKKIFKDVFSEKNFYQQLTYFKDIDYSEKVDFMPGFSVSDEKIKKYLQRVGIEAGKIIAN